MLANSKTPEDEEIIKNSQKEVNGDNEVPACSDSIVDIGKPLGRVASESVIQRLCGEPYKGGAKRPQVLCTLQDQIGGGERAVAISRLGDW